MSGICELCNLRISASNWSRHLKRKHSDKLINFSDFTDKCASTSFFMSNIIKKANFNSLIINKEETVSQSFKIMDEREQNLRLVPKANRLFTLFVATSGLCVSRLENEFLAVCFYFFFII